MSICVFSISLKLAIGDSLFVRLRSLCDAHDLHAGFRRGGPVPAAMESGRLSSPP